MRFFKISCLIAAIFLPIFCFGESGFLSVCDRTPAIKKEIMRKISAIDDSISRDLAEPYKIRPPQKEDITQSAPPEATLVF